MQTAYLNQTRYAKFLKVLLVTVVASALFAASIRQAEPREASQSVDKVKHNAPTNKRLITAGGSITEIVYALGAEDYLIGTDTSSVYPSQADSVPKVGYYRQLSTEGVLSLSPTHVLAISGVGPESVLSQLFSTGLDITVIEHSRSIEGLTEMIKQVGNRLNKSYEADKLANQVQREISEIAEHYQFQDKRIVFLMSAGERGLVAAGSNTVPNLIANTLKANNPFSELNGFKPISVEALMLANPDIILMPEHTISDTSINALCALPSLKFWAQQHGCNLHSVESLPFLGLTPRLPQAIERTAVLLQGDKYANQR